jgi:predicted Zn-dependent protease
VSTAQEIAERALAQRGTEGRTVIVDVSSTAYLRWAGNALTAGGFVEGRRVTVVAFAGGAAGVVSSGGLADEDVAGLVRAAEHAATRSPVTGESRPPIEAPATPDWDEPPPEVPIGGVGTLVRSLESAFETARSGNRSLFGYAEHRLHTTYLATSSGLRLRHVQPAGLADLTARSPDGSAASWTGANTAGLDGADVAMMDRWLEERLSWADRRVELPAGSYEVLLSPSCVADLMLQLYRAAGADDALDGNSAFSGRDGGTRIGDRLTGQRMTLRSDPSAYGLECSPFLVARSSADGVSVFDNGLPLRATDWISEGVLRTLVHTSRSARRAGLPVTPEIGNLILEGGPGGRSLAEMVAGTERGLLLTSLWYLREVDPRTLLLTGLTRDGVHLIDGGEIAGTVNNFRFNESPVELLARVSEIGRTEPALPREWTDHAVRTAMPPLRVADFTMSAMSRSV